MAPGVSPLLAPHMDKRFLKVYHKSIMYYSSAVLDHYEHPRNVGSFPKDADNIGTGMVGAPACGDVMKLQIRVNPETGIIEDAKLKTYGCGSAIAEELALPPVKIQCSILAEDAIKAAVENYRENQRSK